MLRTDLTAQQVRAVVAMLKSDLGEDTDDRLLLDTLEGETDLFEMARKLLEAIEQEEGTAAALTEQMAVRKERRDRAELRKEAHRRAIMALMEAARVDKLPLPEATLSLRHLGPKPIVTDPDALPDALCKFTRKPDMAAIKAAVIDGPLPGVSLDNGGPSLTIRRK